MQKVVVLRYGHRIVRDFRVTSHCCLVARAFGAEKIIIGGVQDSAIEKSVNEVAGRWGGKFAVEFSGDWKKTAKEHRERGFAIAHLTMYGVPVRKKIKEIRKNKKLLVIIGSQKVERGVYDEADYNISVTLQPHSEIAALAVFLDWLFGGKELEKKFAGAKIEIVPQERSKLAKKH